MKKVKTIPVVLQVPMQTLYDLLCTAAEGGSNYWAVFDRAKFTQAPHALDYVSVRVTERDDKKRRVTIRAKDLAIGIERLSRATFPAAMKHLTDALGDHEARGLGAGAKELRAVEADLVAAVVDAQVLEVGGVAVAGERAAGHGAAVAAVNGLAVEELLPGSVGLGWQPLFHTIEGSTGPDPGRGGRSPAGLLAGVASGLRLGSDHFGLDAEATMMLVVVFCVCVLAFDNYLAIGRIERRKGRKRG